MKHIKQVFILSFIIFSLISSGKDRDRILLYVGTFSGTGSEGIYVCSFDTISGDLELADIIKGVDNPNYLVKSADGKYVYICMRPQEKESGNYTVGAFRIEPDGKLSKINEQPAEGIDPCYVDITPDGRFVAVSNYGNGTIVLFKTNSDGSLNKSYQVIQHKGEGANQERQQGPHAHSIQFSPFSNQVYVADLGIDKLMIYDFDPETGKLSEGKIPFSSLPPGSGPRHFDFSPDGKYIYVVNELISSVSVIETKNFKVIQTISSLPYGFEGSSYCADIHVSSGGNYLYCSNRGHNSVSTFTVDKNGTLKLIATTETEGNWPRNFTFSPDEKFLLVANQNSNDIQVFKFLSDKGIPVYINKEIKIPAPVCLKF
ncbi:MAG: lactonase family protein [Prolixibacteraceae bacterium]|nr:lactonase family protein [Prolixibacteraceae bacterium]MBN2775289.1 lactonase family protein [Prolixibacteraceae bacterium]